MHAITTKYLGPSPSGKGSRIRATDNAGHRVEIEVCNDSSLDQNHIAAVRKLCEKMDWHGTLVRAELPGVQVFVWRQEQHLIAEEIAIP